MSHKAIAERIRNKVRYLEGSPYRNTSSVRERVVAAAKLVRYIAADGGVPGLFHLLRTIPFSKPRLVSLVVRDWVIGMSMRDYVDRHFDREFETSHSKARGHLDRINRKLRRYLHRGSLRVALDGVKNTHPNLSFSIKGRHGRAFFRRAARELEGMLRNTRSSVTIYIEEFHPGDLDRLRKMLDRLHRYRDRIVIAADEKSRRIIAIDSSVFNLAMDV